MQLNVELKPPKDLISANNQKNETAVLKLLCQVLNQIVQALSKLEYQYDHLTLILDYIASRIGAQIQQIRSFSTLHIQ